MHGVLLDDGADGINCFPGWGGPDCNTRLCAKNCSKNGVCVAGKCACFTGWAGRLCQHPACENECYYHGECKQGVCQCDVGFHGRDCSQRHVENGVCNLKTGVCKCDTVEKSISTYNGQKWIGEDCGSRTCLNDCSAHGTCAPNGQCQCDQAWMGESCETTACPYACRGRGKCHLDTGKCECDDMWSGVGCEIHDYKCPKDCHAQQGKGECNEKGPFGLAICECKPLPAAQVSSSLLESNSKSTSRLLRSRKAIRATTTTTTTHAVASFVGQKWTGEDCSQRSCPALNGEPCNGNGDCKDGSCFCNPLHIGESCELSSCPNSCSNNGKCILVGLHMQKEHAQTREPTGPLVTGFTDAIKRATERRASEHREPKGPLLTGSKHDDANNSTAVSFLEKLSSSTSSKALQPKCDCDDGFEGQGCETQVCPGNKNCNNHGTCNRKDLSCVCEHGWEGVGCTVPTFCPNKCSNHGKCTEDGCHCDMGWEGKACALKACPQQCNGNGVCSNGVCACNGNFTGPSCDIRQCDNNCTGHGTCLTDLLVCKCEDGWNGPSCEIKWCKGGCGGAHGTCDPSGLTHDLPVCKCLADWGGASCQVPCSKFCNKKGKCTHDDKGNPSCTCESGYAGDRCAEKCPGECSEHGTCVAAKDDHSSAFCECKSGYTGELCKMKICPKLCSGNGECMKDGVCECLPGFGGDGCDIEFYHCKNDCSKHGVCTEQPSTNKTLTTASSYRCVCHHGWIGDGCAQELCDPLCLHGGTCTNKRCMCPSGWSGKRCETKTCPYNCFNHGKCNDKGQCQCDKGYKGDSCHVRHVQHGRCDPKTQTCKCDSVKDKESSFSGQMWQGVACDEKSCPSDLPERICSGHGHCQSDKGGECNCEDGWRSNDCSLRACPNECSGYGTCSSGVCKCDDSHTGPDCLQPICPKQCAGHGTCSKDNNDVPVCTCEAPYTGAACDELECPEKCNGKGVCEHQDLSGTPKCTCQEGFTGETCNVTCPNGQDNNGTTEVCGGHGECFAEHGKAECICSPAYSGISCQAMCNNGCMGRGECGLSEQGVPTCRCDAGYSGDSCQFTTCLNDCSGHGSCDGDGSCTCDREHEGEDCSQRRCPDGCNGHGTCDPIEFTCDCVMGWLDDACSEKVSCVNDCNGHGDCMVERDPATNALLPQCDCHGEWHGPACGRQMCPRGVNTLSCSGHGSCGDDGQCACDGMFEGSACEQHDCTMSKSIGGANATECSGHGTCQEAACVCDLGYTDSSCSIRSCPSFDNKLCGGKGSCDPDGTCACLKEWEGEACHLKTSTKDLPTLPTQEALGSTTTNTAVDGTPRSTNVEDLKEAKEKLIQATESGSNNEKEIQKDVKEVMEDAAKVVANDKAEKASSTTAASTSMRFQQKGLGNGASSKNVKQAIATKMKSMENKKKLQQETKALENAAKKNPKEVEKVAETLVEDVEKEVKEVEKVSTTTSIQDNKNKKDDTKMKKVTEASLKEAMENAEEEYEFAKAEGSDNVAALRTKVLEATELLDTFTAAPALVEKNNSTNNETNTSAVVAMDSPCPKGCSGNGVCNVEDGICTCSPSFTGDDCSYEICSSCMNGMCHENKCVCQTDPNTNTPLFFGEECSLRECPNVLTNATDESRIPCGGHGTCLSTGEGLSDAACDCDLGFSGVGCSIDSRPANNKNNNKNKKGNNGKNSIVGCNRLCTDDCDQRSKGEVELYVQCFQKCSEKCTGIELVQKKETSSIDVPMKVEAETVDTEKPITNVVVPETPGTLINAKKESDTTKATHDSITRAQALTLGEHALARKGRNSNETLTNAKEAEILETTHPSNTELTSLQKCEKCKFQLEKEAGEMDVNHLGEFLQHVCQREGGDIKECAAIGLKYRANQLHDGKNLNIALGRFCKSFFEVDCEDKDEVTEVRR